MNVAGVIIAAGYGTRFLPVTKTVPKELLPLIDRPAIDFVISEMVASGIEDILVITSRRKKALEDYLDREFELEAVFEREGRVAQLADIKPPEASIFFRRQPAMQGTGQAILLARSFVGARPCVVAYPDDLCLADVPLSRQLIDTFEEHGKSLLAVSDVGKADVSRFGVVDVRGKPPVFDVKEIVEKPKPGTEPSRLVSFGRFLFTPEIFDLLARGLAQHRDGEYYHVSAINELARQNALEALVFAGTRLDTGTPLTYLESICSFALTRPDLADQARCLFRRLADQ